MKKLSRPIRRIGLIANSEKPACRDLIRKAAQLIKRAGRVPITDASTAEFSGMHIEAFADAAGVASKADLLMVFGGDGTMLRVAREIAGLQTPMVGINVGALGFLTDVQAHQLPLALKQIWSGETILDSRPLIEASGTAAGHSISVRALNDIVVTRGPMPRLIDLDVCVDKLSLTRYRCDGLIICSPTGSTAYSLSAGGAVVSPSADVFTLTPICPHTLSNRSVVVSLSSIISVQVVSRRTETILSADGQPPIALATCDTITIRRSRHSIRLLHLAGSSFFETLRRKLNWSGSNV